MDDALVIAGHGLTPDPCPLTLIYYLILFPQLQSSLHFMFCNEWKLWFVD